MLSERNRIREMGKKVVVMKRMNFISYASKALFLIFALLFLFPSFASAATFYVTPSGNDINDCLSTSTPCATVTGAMNKAEFIPGDTIRDCRKTLKA